MAEPIFHTVAQARVAQTGKVVVENLVGCLRPGASAVCDTVTVAGGG